MHGNNHHTLLFYMRLVLYFDSVRPETIGKFAQIVLWYGLSLAEQILTGNCQRVGQLRWVLVVEYFDIADVFQELIDVLDLP